MWVESKGIFFKLLRAKPKKKNSRKMKWFYSNYSQSSKLFKADNNVHESTSGVVPKFILNF